MVRRESDGFFNLHTVSFLTVAIFLTVFSVAYGDWYQAKITGHVIDVEYYDQFYADFVNRYNIDNPYLVHIDECFEDGFVGVSCPSYINNCISEIYELGEIIDRGSDSCEFYFSTVASKEIIDLEAYNAWVDEYVEPFEITSACESELDSCGKQMSCFGTIVAYFDNPENLVLAELFEDYCYAPEESCGVTQTVACPDSTKPPTFVVEEVSKKTDSVKESADYASSVGQIISSKPTTESDLVRYKTNLEEAKRRALENYKESSDLSSKYSSFLLSEYQETMVKDISEIEKQINGIESILTKEVGERFAEQRNLAVWDINHDESIKDSNVVLDDYLSTLISKDVIDDPGVIQEPEEASYGIMIDRKTGHIPAYVGVPDQSFGVDFINSGSETLNNCELSITGDGSSWLSGGVLNTEFGFNYLLPGEYAFFPIEINVPAGEHTQTLYPDIRVICPAPTPEGFVMDGFTPSFDIYNPSNYETETGQTGAISEEQLSLFRDLMDGASLKSECQATLDECTSTFPNSCGDISIFYDCAVNNNCNGFEQQCAPYYIDEASFTYLYWNKVQPYYNLPTQCLEDISTCTNDPFFCPQYVYDCAVNQQCSGAGGYDSICIENSQTLGGPSGSQGSSGSGSSGGSSQGSTTGDGGGISNNIGQPLDLTGCNGDAFCLEVANTCRTLSYLIATSPTITDFGRSGYNAATGTGCSMDSLEIYLRKGDSIISTGSNQGSGSQTSGTNGRATNVISIHFQDNSLDASRRNYVAAIVYSLNGHLTLNFFNSPNYNDLENKIYEFIENLLYGDSEGSYITGMSLQQAEEIVAQSASIPWVLWIILFVMVVAFVLFGNFLTPHNERLISSGKKALNKKDYALAIQNYNELATTYSNDLKIKQDALDYLKQIKERVGNSKISLEFIDGALPKIKTNHLPGVFTNYSRVQKMISHAIHDIKKSPKLAKSRMSLISEEYKRLSPKDKERLASEYESLVYRIRNLK